MDLSIIILGNKYNIKPSKNIEVLYANNDNLKECILNSQGKYLAFIKEDDKITEDYLKKIKTKIKKDFDLCFINYIVDYQNKDLKVNKNIKELSKYRCYFYEYIWSFIYKKELFLKMFTFEHSEFNNKVYETFKNIEVISDVIYIHNPQGKRILYNFFLKDIKTEMYYKNIIYMDNGINATFNGYVSWLLNLGRNFSKKDITIIYKESKEITIKRLSKYFNCIKYDYSKNYVCDRLITVYTCYHYPKNITYKEESYIFIHGVTSDFKNAVHFKDDFYTKYIAVSKEAAKGAIGYYPTKKIDYILNPIAIDKEDLKPHLHLVSAQRSEKCKGFARIPILAKILDEENIPYTWEVFTDRNEGTNEGGLIYRHRVPNVLPYINDADYFVLLSDTESFSYVVIESVMLNTKLLLTPIPVYKELGIDKNDNVTFIPFSYFEEKNKDKLRKLVHKIYEEKSKKAKYDIKYDFSKYKELFK